MGVPPPETGYSFPGLENLHNDIYPAISAAQTPSLKQPGKVVLITGAGRGIGRSIALQYAYASVSTIILCSRTASQLDSVEAEIKKINESVNVKKLNIDVADEEAVRLSAETVKRDLGRLDILINNAGVNPPWAPLADTKPSDWWRTVEINLKGPYLFTQKFLPLMIETAEKNKTVVHLLNMSSIGATFALPTSSAYNLSKASLVRLTDFTHAEYGNKGVVAVSVHPGGVETELSKNEDLIKPCEYYSTDYYPTLFLFASIIVA